VHYIRLIISITALVFIFIGCRKENITDRECRNLKDGIQANNKERVSNAVDHLLTTYSKDNLEKFVASISSECNISATLHCFNCIYTNPPESEIKVSFTLSNASIEKVLDVSYDSNNK
jgi:Cu2+-containing amine oxidase